MNRFNYPLVLAVLIGAMVWALTIIWLFNAAGCSSLTPC